MRNWNGTLRPRLVRQFTDLPILVLVMMTMAVSEHMHERTCEQQQEGQRRNDVTGVSP